MKILTVIPITLFFFYLYFSNAAHALSNIRYPISSLDGCRNGRECFLYCQIPDNFPACWSWGKYVSNPNVLGENTVKITFPIADLGNCDDVKACKAYCQETANEEACIAYAQKSGLKKYVKKPATEEALVKAKKELACTDFDSCKKLCEQAENIDKCQKFAQKYKLAKETKTGESAGNLTSSIMKQAVKALGCADAPSCKAFCEKKENQEKCLEFGKRYGIIKRDIDDKETKKREEILAIFEKEFGCKTWDDCRMLCEKPENKVTCQAMYENTRKKSEQSPTPTGKPDKVIPTAKVKPKCANEKECEAYCSEHPSECPGHPTPTPAVDTLSPTPSSVAEVPTPTPTAAQ